MRPSSPYHLDELKTTSPTAPLEEEAGRLESPNTHLLPLAIKARRLLPLAIKARRRHNQHINTICDTTWPLERVNQGPFTDQETTLPKEETNT